MSKREGDDHQFWTTLFEDHNVTPKLPSIAEQPDGVSFPTSAYGKVTVKANAASALGDNFMSDTFIVEARSEKEEKSRTGFIKVLPFNTMMRESAIASGVYSREIGVYTNLFDLLREIRGDKPIPLDVATLYYGHTEKQPDACLLMEDLKAQGFRVVDKVQGCDFDHARIAVRSLAHYHSLTLTAVRNWTELSETTGEKVISYPDKAKFLAEKTMFDTDPTLMFKDWANGYIEFAQDLQRPDLAEWLQGLTTRLPEILRVDTFETCGPLACITHGDYWNNNFMFHYDENGKPDALKMIDFQLSRIGHPLNDLLYFFYSSTSPELRKDHMMELFHIYFDTLKSDLDLLGVDMGYTFEEFLAEYKRRSCGWFLMGGMVMSFVLNKATVANMQDLDVELKSMPKAGEDETAEKGAFGMDAKVEEKMLEMMKKQKMSDNPILTDRLLKLATEVKALNEA